jgi:hypothetical protein
MPSKAGSACQGETKGLLLFVVAKVHVLVLCQLGMWLSMWLLIVHQLTPSERMLKAAHAAAFSA